MTIVDIRICFMCDPNGHKKFIPKVTRNLNLCDEHQDVDMLHRKVLRIQRWILRPYDAGIGTMHLLLHHPLHIS